MARPKRRWSPKEIEQARRIAERNRGRIEAGETYRSQAPSGYRRSMKRSDGI